MSVSESQFIALAKRVSALELASANNTETITWLAGTLGQVKATVDMHTKRLDSIDADLATLKADVAFVKSDLAGLRSDMPGIVAAAMREVMDKP